MTFQKIAFSFLLAISLFEKLYASPYRCEQVLERFRISSYEYAPRKRIVERRKAVDLNDFVQELKDDGKLIFQGNHRMIPGEEFLASNESDWHKTPVDRNKTDLLIGFATNSAWDLAARKKAHHMVLVDWSPQPILGQAYIVAPLMRIAKTPQELIILAGGLPSSEAHGLTVKQAFSKMMEFEGNQDFGFKSKKVAELLEELALDSRISNSELRFLAAYFEPMMTGKRGENNYAQFSNLINWGVAKLAAYWSFRYDNSDTSNIDSVFSSQEHFDHIKSMFDRNRVKYAIADVADTNFYKSLRSYPSYQTLNNVTLSVSNIFDYFSPHQYGFPHFQAVVGFVFSTFNQDRSRQLTVFRTVHGREPHTFLRYEINRSSDIPMIDNSGRPESSR